MSAVRLARGATGRDLIVKFGGGYHGHSDGLLVEAGSGVATLAMPGSPASPAGTAAPRSWSPYNDAAAVAAAFERAPGPDRGDHRRAGRANVGVIPPAPGFLEALRELDRRRTARC